MFPFGLILMTHVNLPSHTVEVELSLTYWGLCLKRKPEKGLTLMLHVGPLGLYIYDLKKQDEWFNQLVEREKDEEVEE